MSLLIPTGYWPLEKVSRSSRRRKRSTGPYFYDCNAIRKRSRRIVRSKTFTGRTHAGDAKPVDVVSTVSGTDRHHAREQARTFLPVEPLKPGKNMYPWGITKEEVEAFIRTSGNPEQTRSELLDLRTVVRAATAKNVREDIVKLTKYPVLETLHPKLMAELQEIAKRPLNREGKPHLYAVPYSVAYAEQLVKSYGLLNEAADAVAKDDEEFARFLRNRARDLLSNDYESGDASWVTGRFKNLNAQIGSYETYDDELYGVKTFFSFCSVEKPATGDDCAKRGDEGFAGAGRFAAVSAAHRKCAKIYRLAFTTWSRISGSRAAETRRRFCRTRVISRGVTAARLCCAQISMRDPNIFEGTSKTLRRWVRQQAKELTSGRKFLSHVVA